MVELFRSNDPVVVSFAASLLRDAGIEHSVADSHMSVIDGSIGAVQNRILVTPDHIEDARKLLEDAGISIDAS